MRFVLSQIVESGALHDEQNAWLARNRCGQPRGSVQKRQFAKDLPALHDGDRRWLFVQQNVHLAAQDNVSFSSRISFLENSLALTIELLRKEPAHLPEFSIAQPRKNRQRPKQVVAFDRYEDYLQWKRREERGS